MKYIKYIIPVLIIFLTIGFAATNVTLSITGDAYIASDLEDFEVYISSIKLDGVEDITLLRENLSFEFTSSASRSEPYEISIQLTNNSSKFDAQLNTSCSISETMTIISSQEIPEIITAKSFDTVNFDFDVSGLESGTTSTLSCTFTVTPIERTEYGEGEVPDKVIPWYVGREITLGSEKFNIISETDTTVTMLAQYNLGTNYWQSTTTNYVTFSDTNGWEYTPGPKEIDIQTWSTNPKTYVNEYVSKLQTKTGDTTLSGDLITLTELGNLGCTVPSNYSNGSGGWTCVGSDFSKWLINGQHWWTRSASSAYSPGVWMVYDTGTFGGIAYNSVFGVRPIITITKDAILNFVPPVIISFTIDDVTYYAEEGMTWRQWVSSGYSNGDFSIGSCYRDGVGGYCEVDSSGYSVVYTPDLQFGVGNGGSVYVDGTIINGSTYYLENLWMDIGEQA